MHNARHLALSLLLALPLAPARPPAQAQTPSGDSAAQGNTLAGDWQADFGSNTGQPRLVFRISKAPVGWRAVAYCVDKSCYAESIPGLTLRGDTLSFTSSTLQGSFQGKLSPDGKLLAGTWTRSTVSKDGPPTQPLTLARASAADAWVIPPPLGAPQPIIAASLHPVFEVTTVKPHDPNQPGGGWRWIGARRFEATMSVGDLLADIYGVQHEQILNAPAWAFKEVYDYAGVPDLPGWPTQDQRYDMERKMLEDRFHLKVHTETRDMSAFVLEQGKGGSIMTPSVLVDPGCTFGISPESTGGVVFTARNASMGDLQRALQQILNKPVVNRTGLHGQFDFNLRFLPDDSVFGGHMHPAATERGDTPPVLFTAIGEQLGLRLNSQKGPVPVIVVDRLERPTPN